MKKLQKNGILFYFYVVFNQKIGSEFLLKRFYYSYRMETHISLFRDNFALVGFADDNSKPLIKDGPADYVFYLSGRRNCQFVHGRITVLDFKNFSSFYLFI